MNSERIKYLQSTEEQVTADGYLPSELISFYTEIFEFQKELFDSTEKSPPSVSLNTPEEGYPLLKSENFDRGTSLDAALKKAAHDLAGIITIHHPDMDFTDAQKILSSSDSPISDSFKKLIAHDFEALEKISEGLKLLAEGYLFLLINSAKPVLASIRDTAEITQPGEEWLESHCPFCGYLPDFASISESDDNKIFLHCGLCEMKWRFKRLTCTNCGNDDRSKLTSYQSEIDDLHSIYCCHECKAYIKIFRASKSRDISSIDFYVENIISNYLDATAIDMGYSRP